MADFHTLLEGYHRFRESGWSAQRERWSRLAEGQSPKVMIIACSDSRVDPTQIFDANPGEMFVVRNVANLVPPYEPDRAYHGVSAALEFAVTQLLVEEIIVMGHGFCGGCAAALTGQFAGTAPGEGGSSPAGSTCWEKPGNEFGPSIRSWTAPPFAQWSSKACGSASPI